MQRSIPIENLGFFGTAEIYTGLATDFLNFDAIFSDETIQFISNPEPEVNETVTIKIRVGYENVDEVFLCQSQGHQNPSQTNRCEKINSDGVFDYFGVSIMMRGSISYYFHIRKNNSSYYYNKRGVFKDIDSVFNFRLITGFKTPDWAKGAIMYQIFVDRFYNGDKSNDVVDNEYVYLGMAAQHKNWNSAITVSDVCNFYGGDLKGIMDKLPYLKSLGIEAIYLNPIFVSPSNHKYDTQDYDYVDPHIGVIVAEGGKPLTRESPINRNASMYIKRTTDLANLEASNQFMISFIKASHDAGIRVILDGVFNHCGAFNKWLDREGLYQQAGYPPGAYREKNSPYNSFFRWYETDNWPNNDCYDGWWGHDNHPKLNYENSQEVYEYVLGIARKWVSPPYNADGWRLDVAADLGQSRALNHRFWQDFRKAVKTANPEAVILAEHYGDPAEWLQGGEWDTVMNYDAFMEPVTWFLTGMEKHSDQYRADMFCNYQAFESAMRYHMARISPQALRMSMNQLSNHDHSRFLTRTNHVAGRLATAGAITANTGVNKSVLMEAVTIQMTWPGAPTVYYGDEAGLCGFTDPDNRRPYPWGSEDKTLIDFHRAAIALRRDLSCLKQGSLVLFGGEYGCFSYGRFDQNGRVAVVINNLAVEKTINIPVWRIGTQEAMRTLLATNLEGFVNGGKQYKTRDGFITVSMPGYSSLVLFEQA